MMPYYCGHTYGHPVLSRLLLALKLKRPWRLNLNGDRVNLTGFNFNIE